MAINVILTGATGMLGKGALLACLESDQVASVLSISRRSTGIAHPKMREAILEDVSNLDQVPADISRPHACFFCLGVSSLRMSEADYRRVTYELTLDFANALVNINPDVAFCYVSGAGTDAARRSMWARVKGETENALLALPFKGAFMFRPGLIQPMKGVKPTSRLFRLFLAVTGFLFPLARALFPNHVTTTEKLGAAFINVALNGYDKQILDPPDINVLAA